MDRQRRSTIAFALVLILVGMWFLAVQYVPGLQPLVSTEQSWPLIIIAFGAVWALAALLTWTPDLLVPAAIFVGIGGLLYWQNMTNHWQSWAYAWTLIPGFVGVGVFLASLLRGKIRKAIVGGGWLVLISGVLFLIFGSFFGGPDLLGPYWPLLIILLGVITLAQTFFQR